MLLVSFLFLFCVSVCVLLVVFFLLICRPPISTLFPYTTLFRSRLPLRIFSRVIPESLFNFLGIVMLNKLSQVKSRHLRQRSEEHTSELQSRGHLVCRLLLEKKKRTL